MTNSWKKIGNDWCVDAPNGNTGDVVTVTNRQGVTKEVTLGERVGLFGTVFALAPKAKAAPAQEQAVGDLSGVLALFGRTKGKLKSPAIVVAVEGDKDADGRPTIKLEYRISLAGERAKVPGSLTVTGDQYVFNRFTGGESREWLGRVLVDGTYQPSQAANGRTDVITASLRELAADPAGVAKRSARLTGRCVFCNTRLGGETPDSPSGRKSLAVGYGQTCAKNYGLPWGVEKFSFEAV